MGAALTGLELLGSCTVEIAMTCITTVPRLGTARHGPPEGGQLARCHRLVFVFYNKMLSSFQRFLILLLTFFILFTFIAIGFEL